MRAMGNPEANITEPRTYYYGVDILRFSAALFVLIYHLGYSAWFNQSSAFAGEFSGVSSPDMFKSWAWFGWIGVEIFFVISGFVICQSASRYGFISFVRSRVVRLYPAVWIVAPISCAAAIGLGMTDVSEGLYLTLKTMTLFPLYPWIDPVYWTLAVEIVFYAVVSLFILKGRWGWIYGWAVIVSLACLMFNALAVYSVLQHDSDATLGLPLQVIRLGFLSYGAFFAVGIFLWYLVTGRKKSSLEMFVAIVACTLELIVHVLYVGQKSGAGYGVGDSVVPVAVFLIALAYLYISVRWPSLFSGMGDLFCKLARTAGRTTYPLYLLHFTAGVYLMSLFVSIGFEGEVMISFVFSVLIGLSYVVSEYLEPKVALRIKSLYDFITSFLFHLRKDQG